LGFLLYYNWARFGNVTDFGFDYLLAGEFFKDVLHEYGTFNVRLAPRNFFYHFIFYPFLIKDYTSLIGGSVFLLSPLFFAIFPGIRECKPWWSICGLLLSIVAAYLPSLIYHGTGWVQFGSRYTLDFIVPMLILTAIGIQKWPLRIVLFLTIISTIQFMTGTYVLINFD